jgi:hypothetical protein
MVKNSQGTLLTEFAFLQHNLSKLDAFTFQKFLLARIFVDETYQTVEKILHVLLLVRVSLRVAFAVVAQ